MTDYERHMPPLHDHDKDKGAMVRTILQGLILAGILWLASSINQQNTAITRLQVQIEGVQSSLAGIPDLSTRVTKMEAAQADLMRRQAADETRWEQLNERKLKGWTR